MAAPEFVPQEPVRLVRNYKSPAWRPDPWLANRPGDLDDLQPTGDRFGTPGPDQGYVYVLARRFEGTLTLTDGEHEKDAIAGAAMVAIKRSSSCGGPCSRRWRTRTTTPSSAASPTWSPSRPSASPPPR
jgi:hypothetical protein